MPPDWCRLAADIANRHGLSLDPSRVRGVGGGSIASSYQCECNQGSFFVKLHPAHDLPVLEAEADGVAALGEAGALRVPRIHALGVSGRHAYLVMEWIEFGRRDAAAQRHMGEGLAVLHRSTGAQYGWRCANFIGSTPQLNEPMDSWPDFFKRCRLLPQLALAKANGFSEVAGRGDRVAEALPALLNHQPPASLLHGDLWGGNWAVDRDGGPVIFDPAVYYGDRETDLAMTRLFGGFGSGFYSAYAEAYPLPAGWRERQPLYQLYHVLNHLNLFGAGYLQHSLQLIGQIGA